MGAYVRLPGGFALQFSAFVPMNLSEPCWEARLAMKTTLHLHRHVPAPVPVATNALRRYTLRLGIAISLVAALVTILVETALDVPVLLIVDPVVVVGFALSWHASGRRLPSSRGDDPPTV
jgi:hypothetical protein